MVKRTSRRSSDKPRAASGETAEAAIHPERSSASRIAARTRAAVAGNAASAARTLHVDSLARRGADALASEAGGIAAAVAVGVGAALLGAELVPGILLGAAAMLAGKMLPQAEGGMRPLLHAAIGAGLSVADKARSFAAEASEQARDVISEVRAERAGESTPGVTRQRKARSSRRTNSSRTEG